MSSISDLVAEITAKAKIVEAELQRTGQTLPNDDVWSEFEFPNIGPAGAMARADLLTAIQRLDKTIQTPAEYFRNLSQATLETSAIRTLVGFKIPEMIPLDGALTYEEISQKSGLGVKALKTMVRAGAVATNFFVENQDGRVAHTLMSSIFHPARNEPDRCMATKWQFLAMLQCGANLQKALERDPTAQDDHASAWAMAFGNDQEKAANFWEYLEKDEEMKRWFHAAMRIVTKYPMRDIRHLVNGYDWGKLHCATIVEVGGSTGQIAAAIGQSHPCIQFYIQDLPEVIDEAEATVKLPSNLHFERANFFEPQPRVADAYIFRTIFHDWSDSHVTNIIRNLVPALRHGARIIVEEILLPAHKSLPAYRERILRRADAIMMCLFNGRERPLEDFQELFTGVDKRFVYKSCFQPKGSILSIMEWVWEEQKGEGQVQQQQQQQQVVMGSQ